MRIWPEKPLDASYGLEILHQYDKKVETKSQDVFGANSNVWWSYRGETGSKAFLPPVLHTE